MADNTDYKQELVEKIRENYLSVALGILVFLVAITLIFRSGEAREDLAEEASDETVVEQQTYVVRPGDSVSSIARDVLGNMERTEEIIEVNNLENPDTIEVGTELVLPAMEAMESDDEDGDAMMEKDSYAGETAMEEASTQTISITGDSYTVLKGDHLWDIAERAYGDGNMYTLIIEANTLANPDRLEEGTVLTLPRPNTK